MEHKTPTRAETVRKMADLLAWGGPEKDAGHFGAVELRVLLDFIYGEPVHGDALLGREIIDRYKESFWARDRIERGAAKRRAAVRLAKDELAANGYAKMRRQAEAENRWRDAAAVRAQMAAVYDRVMGNEKSKVEAFRNCGAGNG